MMMMMVMILTKKGSHIPVKDYAHDDDDGDNGDDIDEKNTYLSSTSPSFFTKAIVDMH